MSQPITSGAEIVRALKASGTPDYPGGPLDPARELLRVAHAGKRLASAAEVVAVLETALTPAHGTAVKARRLMETGDAAPAAENLVPIEDVILGPEPVAEKPPDAPAPASTPAETTAGVVKTVGPEKASTPARR